MSVLYVPALHQRFLEDMRIKVLQPKTQTKCLRAIREVTRFLGHSPDRDGPVTEVLSEVTAAAVRAPLGPYSVWRPANPDVNRLHPTTKRMLAGRM